MCKPYFTFIYPCEYFIAELYGDGMYLRAYIASAFIQLYQLDAPIFRVAGAPHQPLTLKLVDLTHHGWCFNPHVPGQFHL